MIDKDREPSARELKAFGALFALFFGAIGAVARYSWELPLLGYALWILAGVVCLVYYALPPLRRTIVRGWTRLTFPIGWAVSHVALGLVYFVVLTPVGLVMRLLGRDPMSRALERDKPTYWIARRPQASVARYFRQF